MNSKSIKKILTFFVLITVILVNITECCEKKELISIKFSDIDTDEKYNNMVSKFLFEENQPTQIIIICDTCYEATAVNFSDVYCLIKNHNISHWLYNNKNNIHIYGDNKSGKLRYDSTLVKPSILYTYSENQNLTNNIESIKVEETSVTNSLPLRQNYQKEIPREQLLLWFSYTNISSNLHKKTPFVQSMNQYSEAKIQNFNNKKKNFDNKDEIELNFSDMNTIEKLNSTFSRFSQQKNEIDFIIKCDMCERTRRGNFYRAYNAIIYHRKKKHFVCKCNEKYTTLQQAQGCLDCRQKKMFPN